MTGMVPEELITQYHKEGYFIVDDAIAPEMVERMIPAARSANAKVRSGAVVSSPDRIGTDGPGDTKYDILGVIAPEFGEPIFAEYLCCPPLLHYVHALLGTDLRLGWMALFAVPGQDKYDTGWHRDFGKEERNGSEEVEMEILGRLRKNLVKWHMALVDDACLWLVPGSHLRYRTEQEHEALTNDHFADLPEARQIVLKKGQTVFWNGNTIHRGCLPAAAPERLAVMGALVRHLPDDPPEPLEDRFRWRMADSVRAALPPETQLYYDRWRQLQLA
ncbi:MAG: hypothetical protein HOJ45_14665 [Gemmatimonadetes bacterium]|nr:hypothetical protein [Gemmatimonadota bacterium]